jgi:hypothetical protein
MRRMHLKVNSIYIIGKEANELENEGLGIDDKAYVEYLPQVNADSKAPFLGHRQVVVT